MRVLRLFRRTHWFLVAGAVLLAAGAAYGQGLTLPQLSLGFKQASSPNEVVNAVKILMVLTVLTLAPAILIMMTSFTRVVIVLSFVRMAMGIQQMPPNQLLIGLAMFITLFIMSPVLKTVNDTALQPFMANQINQDQALDNALAPVRKFMFDQTRDSDLSLFVRMSQLDQPKTRADVPTTVLVPAFIISELKTAFQIGFIIYLPFLVIDMVTASVLMAMGMMMLPPVIISLHLRSCFLFLWMDGTY